MKSVKTKCKAHPRYQAKRKPLSDCNVCHFLWMAKQINNTIAEIKRRMK